MAALFPSLSITCTVAISFFVFITPDYSAASLSDMQNRRIHSLEGHQTFHPGPNCYNATAFVTGFTDYLYQTSTMELKYYLSLSCHENKGNPVPGDILIIANSNSNFEQSFVHAAVLLENETIFEKGSPTALYSTEKFTEEYRQIALPYTYYAIRNLKTSLYIGNADQTIKYYSCNDNFRKLNNKCESGIYYEEIKSIQKQMQTISLSKKMEISSEARALLDTIEKSIQHFQEIDPQTECSIYYFTQWESISWHILNNDLGIRDHGAYAKLDLAMKLLHVKFAEAKKDPTSKFILSD
ncbi:hypothetical protein [Bdellovibrio sp. KM01]|uniref:hypothetical protein n=1 Tax=Bdellovibrio sp. KM01 TaxID=2748865 RepID=UPI001C67188E|nr:hypothetical protein [Bdellovibrio sp. KM01]